MDNRRNWILAERESGDGLSHLRFKHLEADFDFRSYPERLNIIWPCGGTGPAGVLSLGDCQAMERFEDNICERIGRTDQSVLVLVLTEQDYREYVFYCRSVEGFLGILDDLLEDAQPFPIKIHHQTDRDGEFYGAYANHLLESA